MAVSELFSADENAVRQRQQGGRFAGDRKTATEVGSIMADGRIRFRLPC